MKRMMCFLLGITLLLALTACGGDNAASNAPDLNQYYEDFMATLGDDAPMMADLSAEAKELLDQYYPGLTGYGKKQNVIQVAAINTIAFEMALVELKNAGDVQAVSDIFQDRIDYQVEMGAFYPMTVESWKKAEIITHGNVVALICAGERQNQAVEAFNKLFE